MMKRERGREEVGKEHEGGERGGGWAELAGANARGLDVFSFPG